MMLAIGFAVASCCVSTTDSARVTPNSDAGPRTGSGKRIALSFDDAPRGDGPMYSGDERAVALIASLESVAAPAVVHFVTPRGWQRPGGRARIETYAAAGHLIANHTDTHPWLSRSDAATYLADIDAAADHLAGIANQRPWFRFPFLDEGRPIEKRDAVRAGLAARGLANGYVTIDNYDWYLQDVWTKAVRDGATVDLDALKSVYLEMILGAAGFYDQVGRDALGHRPAHVLLLHENDLAAYFVDDLVIALRADGWEIISPDEAYDDPVAGVQTKTLIANQGHVAALAIDLGRPPRTLDHPAINEDAKDAMVVAAGVFGP